MNPLKIDPNNPIDKLFKHASESHREAINYMHGRRVGLIKSLATPWPRFNDALAGGIEWNTINVIGGRPGSGKTVMANNITKQGFALNTDQTYAVLDFQFEMLGRNSSLRLLSSHMNLSMAQLKSANGYTVSNKDMTIADAYFASIAAQPIYEINDPQTVDNIEKIILRLYEKLKVPLLITIDHSILVKKSAVDNEIIKVLYSLGEMLTRLKKRIPVAFIILSQLNRDIDSKDRMEPYKSTNYPSTSDLFGGDALLQHADNLWILDKPQRRNLANYGSHKWIVDDDKYVAVHLLKARDNEQALMWFEGDFKNMQFKELSIHEYPGRRP